MGRIRTTPASGKNLKKHWVRTVFLPSACCIAAASAVFALYALVTLENRRGEAAIFGLCVGAALIIALWLLGSAYIGRVIGDLTALTDFAKRISSGSFGMKTEQLPSGELGVLVAEINALSEEVARSDKLQKEFVSSVSHELRTPLTAISGWAETLGYDEAIQGDSRRGVEIIEKESNRLTKMVEELLEFSRIQGGRFRLNMESVDIAAEVEDAIFTYSRLMQQENVALCYDCDEESIPSVKADPERLRQVLLNMLDNAVKYGKDGGQVDVSVKSDSGSVIISVRDHGPGIPAHELPHVKEKFYKGSGKARGSGIGLAVCEEIVTRHGGKLTIENAEGGGAIASVRLPIGMK